ncbi:MULTISPECIES: hypothetical protein [Rhodococcus]|uniref:hypothetical protein n=1 Tax=Rhodococcus TaxID=1827 RepID=UPI00167EE0E8|nr:MULTISPECIES: hypothetical protein [Rhodococcus]
MRIRSIKPEFYRSDDIDALDWESRFLFIALWSYVDDNGVGLDKLASIAADLFAGDLERDPQETFARVSRGLQTLSEAGRITRYTVDGKAYLHITNWEKHQRIDKPNKARYPLPTSDNAEIGETVAKPSRQSRETPAPGTGEQGNRGTDKTRAPASPDAAALFEPDTAIEPAAQSKAQSVEQRVTTAAYERVGKAFDFIKVRGIVKWAIHERGADPADVEAALVGVHELGRPHTKSTVGQYLDGYLRRHGPASLTTRPDAPRDVKTGLLVER